MIQMSNPGTDSESTVQDAKNGTLGLIIGQKLIGEITKLAKVQVYRSPTVFNLFTKIES